MNAGHHTVEIRLVRESVVEDNENRGDLVDSVLRGLGAFIYPQSTKSSLALRPSRPEDIVYNIVMMVYFFFVVFLLSMANAAGIADLEGTWSTKSREVVTGPVRLVLCLDRRSCNADHSNQSMLICRASTTLSRTSFSSQN